MRYLHIDRGIPSLSLWLEGGQRRRRPKNQIKIKIVDSFLLRDLVRESLSFSCVQRFIHLL